MLNGQKRFITHVILDDLPLKKGQLKKLFFYTSTTEAAQQNKHYLGAGSQSYNLEKIGNAVAIPGDIGSLELKQKKGLWVNSDSDVFEADMKSPQDDPDKTYLFSLKNVPRQGL